MRADICEGYDEQQFTKFRETLRGMGATISDEAWALEVTIYKVQIGEKC